jgi:hypothetical protein
MRLQIQLPASLWEQVCEQAHREHRYPKQQIEFLLTQALAQRQEAGCEGEPIWERDKEMSDL